MRKFVMGGLVLTLMAVIALAVWIFISGNSREKKVQEEIDSVVKVFDEATNPAASTDDAPNTVVPETIDLEKTVRLLHILDDGYKTSKSMQEYLHFLAIQDYHGIPAEIIDAKKKLIPYYKSIRHAEEDLNEIKRSNLWSALAETEDLTSPNSPLAASIRVAVSGGLDVGAVSSLAMKGIETGKTVYENLKMKKELEKEARKILEENQEAYFEYLEEYTTIYSRYMAQWNQLCLMRDNAYIAINNGDIDGALKTLSQLLMEYPGDRESVLLKAFCLIRKAQAGEISPETDGGLGEAKTLLGEYMKNNPEKTAPALLLLGAAAMTEGDTIKAKTLFDQSSIEYPRQAKDLLDMYNSYNHRNYLAKSVEVHFVQTMYKSMMEGFGFFSPNFQKALVAYDKGDFGTAEEEIFRHFFRRGNQDVYDYLISDMKYVETYMPSILNMIFEEHSFLDLQTYNPTLSFSDKLAIKVENRSDRKLSNVRLFLCLHLTDMYKDEYIVKKMETTVSNVDPHSVADFGKLQLDYEIYGKKKNDVADIVSARAIIMTDSLIIWVDEDKVKRTNIVDRIGKYKNKVNFDKKDINIMNKKWSGKSLADAIHSEISFETRDQSGFLNSVFGSKRIAFHFPRVLDGLNPYFSFGPLNKKDVVLPVSVILNGDHIDVEFEKNSSYANTTRQLYISSTEGVFFTDVTFDEKGDVKAISEFKF